MIKFSIQLMLFLLPFTIIPILNYYVDSRYLLGHRKQLDLMAQSMLSGKIIGGIADINERYLHKSIINKIKKNPEGIVLGNSQAMELRASYFGMQPGDFFNHSVPAGKMHDIIAILGCYKKKGALPKKIIIGVSPMMFDNTFSGLIYANRWKIIASEYYYMLSHIESDISSFEYYKVAVQYKIDELKNLFSVKYALRNFKELKGMFRVENMFMIVNDTSVDAFLMTPDGSIYYPHKRRFRDDAWALKRAQSYTVTLNRKLKNFKMINRERFINLIDHVLSCGSQIIFYLPPYHPIVYRQIEKNKDLVLFREALETLKFIARSRNIPIFGSYDPGRFGFENKDFTDGTHVRDFAIKEMFKDFESLYNRQ